MPLWMEQEAPDSITPPATGFAWFTSDGSQANASTGTPTTVAGRLYRMGPEPDRELFEVFEPTLWSEYETDDSHPNWGAGGPFTLPFDYSGEKIFVFLDGRKVPAANVSITSGTDQLSISGYTMGDYVQLEVDFTRE